MQKNNIKRQYLCGFTIIEAAITVTVLGLLTAGLITIYKTHEKQQLFKQEVSGVQGAAWAIVAYRSVFDSYPCPAPFNIPRTDPKYGYATDCNDTSVSPGTCGGPGVKGYCVANSQRVPALSNPHVRIGTIPFRTLNMPESVAIDAYGDEIMYAVTEAQAQGNPYNPKAGGISIIDAKNNSRVQPPDSVDYVVFSLGADRAGAYARGGLPSGISCDLTSLEGENCDFSQGKPNSIFREVSYSSAGKKQQMDDILVHYIPMAPTLWARNKNSPSDIYAVNAATTNGQAGEDFTFNFNPPPPSTVRLQVNGNSLVEGNTQANQFCDVNDANCFPASMIAGKTGIQCTTPMIGIANAQATCSNGTVTVTCPAPLVLQTLNNGKLGCAHLSCRAATEVGSCGSGSYSLSEKPHGTTLGPFKTQCMSDSYTCSDGSWGAAPSGFCCQAAWSQTASCPGGTGTYTYGYTGDNCSSCIQGSSFNNVSSCPPPVTTSSTGGGSTGGGTTATTGTGTTGGSTGGGSTGGGSTGGGSTGGGSTGGGSTGGGSTGGGSTGGGSTGGGSTGGGTTGGGSTGGGAGSGPTGGFGG